MEASNKLMATRTPHHVAIIMDGNGRWAQNRGKPRLFGHHAGAKRVREVVEACPGLGVKYITIFAFSTENWKRSEAEVTGLMSLFRRYIRKETRALCEEGVRVRFIGNRSALDKKLQSLMGEIETMTKSNSRVHMTIALNYGGRDDITRASQKMTQAVVSGQLNQVDIDENTLNRFLDTAALPDPDLVIRTSGEKRVSNFLLWQSAYSEFEFTDILWPDFSAEVFAGLIAGYTNRDRRFGAVVTAAE
jgi:undecaprenyl diphosphate synthase